MKTDGIDLLLLCGARPELLAQTLASFAEHVFPNFDIVNVFANIDPFQGGADEVKEVEAVILGYFPAAKIRKPEKPSFPAAVAWLWSQVQQPHCLHLEDDWVAQHPISREAVLPLFSDTVRQVSILTKEKEWRSTSRYHCEWRRRRFLGVKFGRVMLQDEPVFTTSPCFLEREFANTCGAKMDLRLDPEKQLFDGRNKELRAYNRKYRNILVGGDNPFWIRDIGREFRDSVGLSKAVVNGESVWTYTTEAS
ncbi:hypothetical protein [Jannaschia helgolandensis]|uniref:Glycosyl transferase family 2 n=1 Tax=Jannaschia helgolandensis TaxID=188906 RepID=A0A1H7S3R5_9RHOB|nr:hypothetical protein [Jannaschia helgolandensis]SEL67125.1 hypothetical protein SAMN04488526_3255 [Jannaschia helgolandensis]